MQISSSVCKNSSVITSQHMTEYMAKIKIFLLKYMENLYSVVNEFGVCNSSD